MRLNGTVSPNRSSRTSVTSGIITLAPSWLLGHDETRFVAAWFLSWDLPIRNWCSYTRTIVLTRIQAVYWIRKRNKSSSCVIGALITQVLGATVPWRALVWSRKLVSFRWPSCRLWHRRVLSACVVFRRVRWHFLYRDFQPFWVITVGLLIVELRREGTWREL